MCSQLNSYSKTVAFEILKFKYKSQCFNDGNNNVSSTFAAALACIYICTPTFFCSNLGRFTHIHTHTQSHTQIESLSDNRSLSNDFAKNCSFLTLKMYGCTKNQKLMSIFNVSLCVIALPETSTAVAAYIHTEKWWIWCVLFIVIWNILFFFHFTSIPAVIFALVS